MPGLVWLIWQQKAWQNRQFRKNLLGVGLILGVYCGLWLVLPYLAYRFGWQEHFINRGLFYFLGRAGEGVAADPVKSLRALAHYSSLGFMLWTLAAFCLSWFVKQLKSLQPILLPSWLAMIGLSRPSLHILLIYGLIFFQGVMAANWLWGKWPKWRSLIVLGMLFIIAANSWQLYAKFLVGKVDARQEFLVGHLDAAEAAGYLDEAVVRMYQH